MSLAAYDNDKEERELSMDEILASIRRYVSSDSESDADPRLDQSTLNTAHHGLSQRNQNPVFKESSPKDDQTTLQDNTSLRSASFQDLMKKNMDFKQATPESVVRLSNGHSTEGREPLNKNAYQPSSYGAPYPAFQNERDRTTEEKTLHTTKPQTENHIKQTPLKQDHNHNIRQDQSEYTSFRQSDHLISEKTESTIHNAFEKLNQTMQNSSASPQTQDATMKVMSNKLTLDEVFFELARPMIKEWLDHHLPQIVESMVAREIERITQGLKR